MAGVSRRSDGNAACGEPKLLAGRSSPCGAARGKRDDTLNCASREKAEGRGALVRGRANVLLLCRDAPSHSSTFQQRDAQRRHC